MIIIKKQLSSNRILRFHDTQLNVTIVLYKNLDNQLFHHNIFVYDYTHLSKSSHEYGFITWVRGFFLKIWIQFSIFVFVIKVMIVSWSQVGKEKYSFKFIKKLQIAKWNCQFKIKFSHSQNDHFVSFSGTKLLICFLYYLLCLMETGICENESNRLFRYSFTISSIRLIFSIINTSTVVWFYHKLDTLMIRHIQFLTLLSNLIRKFT